MKKIMSLMLGMSLVLGAASMFAQDKPADTAKTEKKAKKTHKSKKAKTTDTTTTPAKP